MPESNSTLGISVAMKIHPPSPNQRVCFILAIRVCKDNYIYYMSALCHTKRNVESAILKSEKAKLIRKISNGISLVHGFYVVYTHFSSHNYDEIIFDSVRTYRC